MTRIPDPAAARDDGAGRSAEQHGRAGGDRWQIGAAGEQDTAALLQPLALTGWVVLHDRAVAGSPANIDHLVSDGATLWVIDSKVWRGDIVLLGDGQLWYADAPVNDRLAPLVFLTDAAAHAASRHPDLATLALRPIACIHGAHLPASPTTEDGVLLVHPSDLVAHLVRHSTGRAASALSEQLDAMFPARCRPGIDTYVSMTRPQKRNYLAPSQLELPLQ